MSADASRLARPGNPMRYVMSCILYPKQTVLFLLIWRPKPVVQTKRFRNSPIDKPGAMPMTCNISESRPTCLVLVKFLPGKVDINLEMLRLRILKDHGFGLLQFCQQEFVSHDHIPHIAIGLEMSLLAPALNPHPQSP